MDGDRIDPGSLQATDLELAASERMRRGDAEGAVSLLERARASAPPSMSLQLSLAAARRRLGQYDLALAAVEDGLKLAPRDFTALLMRASLLERMGRAREAAVAYGEALTQCPASLDLLNAPTRQAALHARDVYGRHRDEVAAVLLQASGPALEHCPPSAAGRVRRFIDHLSGGPRLYRQEPTAFFYPGLPAIEFYDREVFPWLDALEAQTDTIEEELRDVIGGDGFTPYVAYDERLPLDQWRALNHSPAWSAFHLLFNGSPVPENAHRCPKTLQALSELPQPRLPGRSPAAMFSVLKARTRIPPHTGVSNTRLVCHLPLIVPPGCGFRVGSETRSWVRGQAWVFDDTIEHEAYNDSDRDRIILIFDVEQPAISAAEHAAIAEITRSLDTLGASPIAPVL